MHVQSRLADRELTRSWSLSQPAPARAISPGYPPLSSELEHHFMIQIDLMIHAFVWTEDTRTRRLQGYDVTIALQEPWIRNALFGVVSLRAAAMGLVPPDRPDQYYRAICEEIQHRKPGLSDRSGKEQLLVAVVWKALIEDTRPNAHRRSVEYVNTVGRLLFDLDAAVGLSLDPSPAELLHGKTLEIYLHFVCDEMFFQAEMRPQFELFFVVGDEETRFPPSSSANQLIPFDLNVLCIFAKLCHISCISPRSEADNDELQRYQTILQQIRLQYGRPEVPSKTRDIHFRAATQAAVAAVSIFALKLLDPRATPADARVLQHVRDAVTHLKLLEIPGVWAGYMVWVFSILLCAAAEIQHIKVLLAKLDEMRCQIWPFEMQRLEVLVSLLIGDEGLIKDIAIGADGEEILRPSDTLLLMLNPPKSSRSTSFPR